MRGVPVEGVGTVGDAIAGGEFLAGFEDLDEFVGWGAVVFGVAGCCGDLPGGWHTF